jgi:hypothetical protein
MTRHVKDADVGLHRKKAHTVRHGRSVLHPGEIEESKKRSHHRVPGTAHDVDVALAKARHDQAKRSHGHKRK